MYTYSETGEKDDEGRDYYSRSDADHAGTSELYALIGDSSEWQLLATYDGTTVKLQDGFTDLTVNGATVYLPEGTAQVKVVAKTDKDSLTVSYSVGLTVRPTEEVIRIIEAAMEANDYVLLQLFNLCK